MKFIQNWYSDYEVAKLYAQYRKKDIFVLSNKFGGKNKPFFLEFIHKKTKNYLPVNSYSSFLIDKNSSFDSLSEIEKEFRKENATAAYIPIISEVNPKLILPTKYSHLYSERLDSFYINLENDLEILRKKISKRKRSFIKLDKFNAEFRVAEKVEKEYFFPLYKNFMDSINASEYSNLNESAINSFLNLNNNILFLIKIDQKILLMHLIGINQNTKTADFVFSASSEECYYLGYTMIWNEICFLKSIGYKKFYLGGGIKRNDGVENFKKKMGGEIIFNGGIKLILDKVQYEKEANSYLEENYNSFFPVYLRDQFLSNKR